MKRIVIYDNKVWTYDMKNKNSHKKNSIPVTERDAVAIMRGMLGGAGAAPDDLGYAVLHKGVHTALNIDTLVQSTDMPHGMTLRQAARKSVIACISDFAAKGVRPKAGAVSVSMPKSTTKSDVTDIARGLADATKEYNIRMVAGDTNAGMEFSFSVCMFGVHAAKTATGAKKNKTVHVTRGGAGAGDKIFVTGPFGYTALGLDEILLKRPAENPTVKRAIRHVMMPKVQMEFGIAGSRYFTSAMDSSDGLASTLNEMARQSRCDFEIHTAPTTRDLEAYAHQNGRDMEKMIFEGGEEYEIVFTAQPSKCSSVSRIAAGLNVPLIEIGEVGRKASKKEGGAAYYNSGPVRKVIGDSGWDHFAAA